VPRLRKCGRIRLGDRVQIRHTPQLGAGFAGLATCGSVWACPCCSVRILNARRGEVATAIGLHLSSHGAQLAMLTLTMRHRRGQSLAELWDALGYAWAGVTSGKGWKTAQARYGLAGWVRVVEVTHGGNGWHVHVHALLFLDRAQPVEPSELVDWRGDLSARWSRALERKGLSPALERAQDLHMIDGTADPLAEYFTKQTDDEFTADALSQEFTRSASKTARGASVGRSPWRFLDGAMGGDADELALWWEFESASRGRRQMTWSRGFRDRLGLNDPESDEAIAEREEGSESDTLCQFEVTLFAKSDSARSPPRLSI